MVAAMVEKTAAMRVQGMADKMVEQKVGQKVGLKAERMAAMKGG